MQYGLGGQVITVSSSMVRQLVLAISLALSLGACSGGQSGAAAPIASASTGSDIPANSTAPDAPVLAPKTSPVLPLAHAGRWITDAQGRVVIIHGMNYVKKDPTTLPDKSQTLDPAADGFGDNDLQWLADNGFNGLRLGIEDYGVEPQPGIYDDTYIGQIAAMAKLAASHGVYPLIDFHQDDYSPAFGGNGFPAWMVQDDGLPHQPDVGFPYSQFTMPAMLRAWDHFWANDVASDGVGLQDHFAAAVAHSAAQFVGIDGLLGYEYLNEPWPGTVYATCTVPLVGCPIFDATLTGFNRKVAAPLRAVDQRHLIFAEPNVIFNDGVQTNVGALNDSDAGFAFHVYCLLAGADANSESPGGAQLCPTMEELAFSNADAHAAKTGEALMLTEYGATPDTEVVSRNTASADAHMVSWLWWTYNEGTGLNPSQDPPDTKINNAVADLLVCAYPQIVAGTPLNWSFNPATHVFDLQYSTARAGGGTLPADAQTVVFLPARHYKQGYKVTVSGATVVSKVGATLLQLVNQSGANTVTLHVEPQ